MVGMDKVSCSVIFESRYVLKKLKCYLNLYALGHFMFC